MTRRRANSSRGGPMVWLCMAVIIPLTPIWLPVVCVVRCFKSHSHTSFDEMKEKKFREGHAKAPRALPLRRRYNPSNESLLLISSNHRSPSPLLRLPYSVPQQIYDHLFANKHCIHIERIPYRLTQTHFDYPPCWGPDQNTSRQGHYCVTSLSKLHCSAESPTRRKKLDIGVLLTCRQLYQEGMPLLYSTNTFDISQAPDLLYLYQTTRPHRFSSIKYLQLTLPVFMQLGYYSPGSYYPYDIETWERLWGIVRSHMTGLKELDLELQVFSGEYEQEKEWLGPVGAVRGLTKCTLSVIYSGLYPSVGPQEVMQARRNIERNCCIPREAEADVSSAEKVTSRIESVP